MTARERAAKTWCRGDSVSEWMLKHGGIYLPITLEKWLLIAGYDRENPVGPETEFPEFLCDPETGYLLGEVPKECRQDD